MCNCLDRLHRRAEQQSFNNSILKEIEETKQKLKQKILNLQIEGNHYQASQAEVNLLWLIKAEECMRKMLGCERVEHDALSPGPYALSLSNGLSLSRVQLPQKPNKKMKGEKQ